MNLKHVFENFGIIKKGHFRLTSGRHSDLYINKNLITADANLFKTTMIKLYCRTIEFQKYDIITGPATAGAVLASALASMQNAAFIYPEKIMNPNGSGEFLMEFRRGYDKIIKDKRILLVEDIITTGGSVQKTIDSIEKCKGKLSGVIAIWNRSGWEPDGYYISSLINEPVNSWEPEECPLCKDNITLTDPKS